MGRAGRSNKRRYIAMGRSPRTPRLSPLDRSENNVALICRCCIGRACCLRHPLTCTTCKQRACVVEHILSAKKCGSAPRIWHTPGGSSHADVKLRAWTLLIFLFFTFSWWRSLLLEGGSPNCGVYHRCSELGLFEHLFPPELAYVMTSSQPPSPLTECCDVSNFAGASSTATGSTLSHAGCISTR